MLKNRAKKFGDSDFFRNFAIPKLEQNAPNQLSFNKLGKNKETLKHLENVPLVEKHLHYNLMT